MAPERWERIQELFEEAVGREPTSRASFLAAACKDDAELRAELEQLLAEDEIADGLLDQPLMAVKAKALSAGMRLGPYEISAPNSAPPAKVLRN
jgi:hypothetical protein